MKAKDCNKIFNRSIVDYHIKNDINQPVVDPFEAHSMESLLYRKNWIDTVQWHLEDLIRDPDISPSELVALKRRIDKSNQERTDMVEQIDDWFMNSFREIKPEPEARMNSETPAWLLDRMSILALKVYHMEEQTRRKGVSDDHLKKCQSKLAVLLEQTGDMELCFDQLIDDIKSGERYMKVYRQMKMYNDQSLNPVLYQKHSDQ